MFQSAEFLDWVRDMGCEVHLITPEMHQSNGQVERYCRTVLNMIRIEANHRQQKWPSVIWKIQLVLNITRHRTTQYSALNLLVGIDAATPLIRSLVRDALREMGRQRASERLRQNQQSQDNYVNQGRKAPRGFELNSLVFVRKQAQSTGKLDSGMRGPYRVMKVLPHGRADTEDEELGATQPDEADELGRESSPPAQASRLPTNDGQQPRSPRTVSCQERPCRRSRNYRLNITI
ncbi:hypothetical protein ABMA27_014528 [Loxostege sticticalis]|uniref:Integrase catalytic domain-containing protein n=1 Tax=Loxostege sticticalis TaxID=481309 RepID=A0ABR3I9B4_LOXSC